MPDVFISHATADDEVVSELHDELEARTGVEMWVDHKDIKPGENWQNKIESALKTCPYLLMVVSRNAVKSDEVTAEWRAALTYNHALLLAIIDDVPHEDIPARLRLHQWVDLQTDREAGLAKLAAAITGEAADTDAPTFTRRATLLGGEAMDRRLTSIPIQGREAELVEVRSKLELRQPVMVLAYGGSGKSRLAAELALTDTRGALWHVCSESSQPYTVTDLLREHFGMED
ncbi:MAG: toll/interleukin-1 receptor domain-containing protein, partial [Anaerolineae bacterium]|nr:toll/interleukin-1 receptor domain-containing protein [Anaerolineae bacterium]